MAQHISIRVPWKDNGYCGMVCNKPCLNDACLRLKNVIHHCMNDSSKPIKEKEQARFDKLCAEFGM